MSELALYRKYRPRSFDDLIGQDSVVRSLKGAIEKGTVAHSYLFVGTRGVGKTSAARIFAKELGVSDKDLYELDAASNRGIDDFRHISESVYSLPFESKYKIYIIDEVHMLTKEAFNAFLKTLEEPPEYVIFILATTNPEKVPETIKSRCQIQEFRKADFESISRVMQKAAKNEGYEIEEDAINLIAFASDGSFRDAFSLLQKAISTSSNKKITADDLEKIASIPPLSKAVELLQHIANGEKARAIELVIELDETGADIANFSKLLLDIMRDILLLRFASEAKQKQVESKYRQDTLLALKNLAKDAKNINSALIASLLEKLGFLPFTHKESLPLELFVIESFETK